MKATALELLVDIIDTSETLLKLLDASSLSATESEEKTSNINSHYVDINKKLLSLTHKREQKIHLLFKNFNHQQLSVHADKVQIIAELDSQIVNKVNSSHKSAKFKILTLKKNKKAIGIYQKS